MIISLLISFLYFAYSSIVFAPPKLSIDFLRTLDLKVALVLSDMDGTLLNSDHKVSDASIRAIQLLQNRKILFLPATGRTRKSMVDAAGPTFVSLFGHSPLQIPGVYSQGLVVYGMQGEKIHERFIEKEAILLTEQFCADRQLSVIAYAGDRIFCRTQTYHTKKVCDYGDTPPEEFPSGLYSLVESGIPVNKLIVLEEQEKLVSIRPELESLVQGKATLTTAVPGMLEVLPFGASKGEGVRILLEHLSISPQNCVAFGDGENDIEMLQLVKLGIAMENGKAALKAIASALTASNDEDGVAAGIHLLLQEQCASTSRD